MKNRRAILSIVPDARQEHFLARVIPSWKRYAQRHNLEIIIVRRSISGGQHPYWDRWLTIQDGVPEVAGFRELLLLDIDIFITDEAPDVFKSWDPSKIGVAEESAQGPWNPSTIPSYYRTFHVEPDDRLPNPTKVFNFGVCVLDTRNRDIFKALYDKWLRDIRPRFAARELRERDIFFRFEADGPFLSYELQTQNMISPLPGAFNFFLPPWLEREQIRRLPFLVQCKLAQKLVRGVPTPLLNVLTARARSVIQHAAEHCYFLHVAGSKSPLWLLPDANQSRDQCSKLD